MGAETSLKLEVIKINTEQVHLVKDQLTLNAIKQQYGEVFQGLGEMEQEYEIQLDENVQPVVHPPRKVPIAI